MTLITYKEIHRGRERDEKKVEIEKTKMKPPDYYKIKMDSTLFSIGYNQINPI